MSDEETKIHPSRIQHVSQMSINYIEIDGVHHQYTKTAKVIDGVRGEFEPPEWVKEHLK